MRRLNLEPPAGRKAAERIRRAISPRLANPGAIFEQIIDNDVVGGRPRCLGRFWGSGKWPRPWPHSRSRHPMTGVSPFRRDKWKPQKEQIRFALSHRLNKYESAAICLIIAQNTNFPQQR